MLLQPDVHHQGMIGSMRSVSEGMTFKSRVQRCDVDTQCLLLHCGVCHTHNVLSTAGCALHKQAKTPASML